jgi:hypothetical protein
MYLLICRCKDNIDRAIARVKESYDEEIFLLFNGQVSNLEERVRLKYEFFTDILTSL